MQRLEERGEDGMRKEEERGKVTIGEKRRKEIKKEKRGEERK